MFLVVTCQKCGKLQTTQSKDSLKCRFCGRSTAFSKLKIHHRFYDAEDAIEMVKQINMKKGMSKDRAEGEFFTYK